MSFVKHLFFFFLTTLLFVCSAEEDVRNAEPILTSFTVDQQKSISQKASKQEFQAEVTRLMEIIINSLYKTRDIFLRELISNANDASDKLRYLSLTDPNVKIKKELEIKVQADKQTRTIVILDNGIGMTAEELAKNLGTIAHSGTASFLDQFAKATAQGDNPLSLIGQFGVGFYSAFLVADEVTVVSASYKDGKQHIWHSTANGSFTVSEDPRGNTLGRGSAVILKIKEDAENFLDNTELENTIKRYSEFIQYPIYLYSTKKEEVEESAEKVVDEEELSVSDDESSTKKVEKETHYWKRLNQNKPIWSRRASSISEEEYEEFYKQFAHDTEAPLAYTHFKAEGEVEFDSILFIPKKAPYGMYDQYYNTKSTLKLYVRRVLVADEFEEIIPRYLNFIKGLVDSNDLPLNVNREDLQKNKVMTLISRKLTRKVLDMLRDLSNKEEGKDEEEDEDDTEGKKEKKPKKKDVSDTEENKNTKYLEFWQEFGKSIKLGVLEDQKNRKRLLELLRFPSSVSPKTPISLNKYIERMKPNQKNIYYISGQSLDDVENSPFMQRIRKQGYEVLYFVDNLDEYLNIQEYEDHPFQSITKEGLEIDNKKMKDYLKTKEEEFEQLISWLKDIYGPKVSRIQVSSTLEEAPMAIGTAKHGYTAQMERIAKAQAFGSSMPMKATKILQLNYRHPIIIELNHRVQDGEGEDGAASPLADYANLLFDMALVQSGFGIEHEELGDFAKRIVRVSSFGLKISPSTSLAPEPDFVNEADSDDDASTHTQFDDEDEMIEEDADKEDL